MKSFYILSHLFLVMLLSLFVTQVNAQIVNSEDSTIIIIIVLIVVICVGALGVIITITLCKITNICGIFNSAPTRTTTTTIKFSTPAPPPTSDRQSDHLIPSAPPPE